MKRNRIFVFLLSASVMAAMFPLSASARGMQKEEVIYADLACDGSVREINAVNSFHLENGGTITDYGDYESIRNMTTTDEIEYKGDRVTVDTDSTDFYYEGRMREKILPWNISIGYALDGRSITASELAGKSGELEIRMNISENPLCDGSFSDAFGLQVTFLLDSEKASDIHADGATIANSGKNRQITYMILPGSGKDISIECSVSDFEMDRISVNGVRMNFDISIDEEEIERKLDEVTCAAAGLSNGAQKLSGGMSELELSADELYSVSKLLNDGMGRLSSGMGSLHQGLKQLTSQNDVLTSAAWKAFDSLCFASEIKINQFLREKGMDSVTITPDTYEKVLDGLLAKIDREGAYRKAKEAAYESVSINAEKNADRICGEYIRSQSDSIYLEYVKGMENDLYMHAAELAAEESLMEQGLSREQAEKYLQTDDGRALTERILSQMNSEQKASVLSGAVSSLTEIQKKEILDAALSSLTKAQRDEIVQGYIEKMMVSEEITAKINEAVREVDEAAAAVSEAKGSLDGYRAFCLGLEQYTGAVAKAEASAGELNSGLSELLAGSDSFKKSMKKLAEGSGELSEGASELADGAGKLRESASKEGISEELNAIVSDMTGKGYAAESFTSDKNTSVKSVQFVIQADGINEAETEPDPVPQEEKKTFFEKLAGLFR